MRIAYYITSDKTASFSWSSRRGGW